ncbi:hypothetical protein GE09DRAFT_1268445 [Coniochaeta sp. 2T2.1]|nr:hypothetical protein GE09DRAFT_1268445 [Coniochaeta sp. 2T2.1]
MIASGDKSVIVTACPDSGSDDNIISHDFAMSAGFKIQVSDSEPRRFSVANGKVVEAVGQVQAHCAFVTEDKRIPDCIFHVFNTLAVPVIMGMDFLRQTETLTKHTYRLVKELAPAMQSLRVNSVGKPKQSLLCRLNNYVGCARPDTGSDLDLVSRTFANSRGFAIEPAFEQLEFADCSIGYTSGLVRGTFSVGDFSDVRGFLPRGEAIDLEFYVLDSLNSDILLGQDTIDELGIFSSHVQSFIPSLPCLGESDVNIIRHIGKLERSVSEKLKKLKHTILASTPPRRDDDQSQDFETQTKLHEQRENARLEAVRSQPVPVGDAGNDSGAHERGASQIADFDGLRTNYSGHLLSTASLTTGSASVADTTVAATDGAPPMSPYASPTPGCSTPPFVAQPPLDRLSPVRGW